MCVQPWSTCGSNVTRLQLWKPFSTKAGLSKPTLSWAAHGFKRNGEALHLTAWRRRDAHSDLANLAGYPARLVFFRSQENQRIVASNVLFDILSIRSIALDVLHIMDLGVAQYAAAWALTTVLIADCYNTGCTNQSELLTRCVRAMHVRLMAWYRLNRSVTRVSGLTVGMILGTGGTVYRPCVRAKGGESRGLLFFARAELRRFVDAIGTIESRALLTACDNLCSYYDVMESAGRVLYQSQVQQLLQHVVNHNTLFRAAGGTLAPKTPSVDPCGPPDGT